MKILIVSLLFIFTASLIKFTQISDSDYNRISTSENGLTNISESKEISSVATTSQYFISAQLDSEKKKLNVQQKIVWHNKTGFSTKEFWLHLYPNAFKNNKTFFMDGKNLSEEEKSEIIIKSLKVNSSAATLKYQQPYYADNNDYDSTTGLIELEKIVKPGDSIYIEIEYELKIPRVISRSGYDGEGDFFFISQWFPKHGVFENGVWICNPFYPFTEFYSDFSFYSVNIEVPKEFSVGASGVNKNVEVINDQRKIYSFEQNGIHDFAFFASKNIVKHESIYTRADGSQVKINFFVNPKNLDMIERYQNAVIFSFDYFERNIGVYPYSTFTVVDVPFTASKVCGMEYPTLITICSNLFNSEASFSPEDIIVHEFAHQYFYGILANNEVYEAWLDEGFATYFTNKIIYEYYGKANSYFNLVNRIPIRGLQIYQIEGIPLIYTLRKISVPPFARELTNYYKQPEVGTIADSSFRNLNSFSYYILAYAKPSIMLQTLENNIGYENMMKLIREYYNRNKFTHITANDFFDIVKEKYGNKYDWLIEEFYKESNLNDNMVFDLQQHGNKYEVTILSKNQNNEPLTLALYTDSDTLFQTIKMTEEIKRVIFVTNEKVLGAEIDPDRKNLFDLNFANNSKMIKGNYEGSISVSIRWFYWLQALLISLGGLS